jgi:hypothetical protein
MYKVYCDGELIYLPGDPERSLIAPKADIEVNKAGSFDFTIVPGHFIYDKIKKLNSSISILNMEGDKEIWAGRPTEVLVDFFNQKKVHCEGELAYLNDSIQRPREYRGVSVVGYLNHLIDNHNAQVGEDKQFKVGIVTVRDSNDYLLRYTNWESTYKAIFEDLIEPLGGYVFIRKENNVRYIDYLADFMHTNTQKIEFGENLLDFSKNFETTDVTTCLIPLGSKIENPEIEALGERVTIESVNGGIDYIMSPEAAALYGKISKTITYDDVKDPNALLRKGKSYLKAVQWENMTLEAKAIDLHFINGNIEQFKVGEYIRVVSNPHGMDTNFPLVKMSIKLDKLSENIVTLGTKRSLSLSTSSIEANAEIKKALDKVPQKYDVIELAKSNATKIIDKVMGGFVVKSENELLIMDTNDIKTAKNVWRWNVNGLGYSSNGYSGPYGTALTMDGALVADIITTGILKGGKVHFNLNQGTFILGESEADYFLKFDGEKLRFGAGAIESSSLTDDLKNELKGEDGSDANIFEWLKDWNSTATVIDGARMITPNLYTGDSDTGLFLNVHGLYARKDGKLTAFISTDGSGFFGNEKDSIEWDPYGNITLPKITTDAIYPGENERIILERGIAPGANDAKSIDATGDAIRLKYGANSYVSVSNFGVSAYRNGERKFATAGQYDGISVASGTVMSLDNPSSLMVVSDNTYWVRCSGTMVLMADSDGVYSSSTKLSSDAKLKENLCKIGDTVVIRKNENVKFTNLTGDDVFDFLKNTSLFNYNFKGRQEPCFSPVAQLIKDPVRKYIVSFNKHTKSYSIDAYNYVSIIHAGMQEEIKKREALEERVKTSEDKIKELERNIYELKKIVLNKDY